MDEKAMTDDDDPEERGACTASQQKFRAFESRPSISLPIQVHGEEIN